jgi:dipeptidyl aminopeptidase/acylaminoacyl peptidase
MTLKRRMTFVCLALGLILTAGAALSFCAAPSQPRAFSLESVLSAPFPSDLVASPRGDALAWVQDDQGRRNIWLAAAPEFKARAVTHFDRDDGLEISDLTFSRDGSILVFVRNQGPNRSGEFPNPTSSPQGAEQAVWAVKTAGGGPWRIGPGNGPCVSPAEDLVVFSQRGGLWSASLSGSAEPKPFFKARGSAESYSFSPDGSRLVFSSDRGDHSFIGVYDLKAGTVSWVAPSVDRDVLPVFSPDGSRVAFLRFPGSRADFFEDEQGRPFSIMIADTGSAVARQAWRSPDASGGFAQYYFPRPLAWAAGGRLVFYSEHEGWTHLYSLDPGDGRVQCLSPGEFEVEDSRLSSDLETLVFNSNQGDIDRRHLWAVPVAGGEPRLLTPGRGIEWAPTPLSGGLIGFLCSTARQPAAAALVSFEGRDRHLIAPNSVPDGFPTGDLVEPEQVIFRSADGLEIHGQLFLPRQLPPGARRPAVIFMHGGPIRQMLLGWHYMYYYHNSYAFNQYLASRGYVVLSVNYRLGIGYGRAFREAPQGGPRGAAEYRDILAAALYLHGRPEVDPGRVGLWGGSYGGYLTALGLARDSALFASGVDLHGVHDWSAYIRAFAGPGSRARSEEAQRLAYDSSPVASLDFWASPVLLIHGDDDRNVEFSQTTDLARRLRELGRVHLELLILPDEVHDFLRHADWLAAYHAASDFFDRTLRR